MKLPMISRPSFLCNDKQKDDTTYISSASSVQSDADSVRRGFRSSYSLRSLVKKSQSFRHSICETKPEVSMSRANSTERTAGQDETCARSKSLLIVAKDAFRSFRITKNFAADARRALGLDVDERSSTIKNEKRRKDEANLECAALDESMSAHSILGELLMEEYVDPYADFLEKLERKKGVVEEFEIDKLTQLPSIPMNISQRDLLKNAHRRNCLRNSSPAVSCTNLETESLWDQTNQTFDSAVTSNSGGSAVREIPLHSRSKISRMSSLPDLSRLEKSMHSSPQLSRQKYLSYRPSNRHKIIERIEL